jgi:hypothetical protein
MPIAGGRPASDTSTPGVSAIRLNEWPVPTARIRGLAATSSCSSARSPGRASWLAR